MTIAQAMVLGAVQGVTELLPVSSDGHLVIFQRLFGLQHELAFDVFVHVATLGAVVTFFNRRIFSLTWKYKLHIVLGIIPVAVLYLAAGDLIEESFNSTTITGLALIYTGVLNWLADFLLSKRKQVAMLTWWRSILIGSMQSLAMLPGVSRSASTVSGGIITGLDREEAFDFSFIMAVPLILGAAVLQIKDLAEVNFQTNFELLPAISGFVTAFIVGLASINLFKLVIHRARLEWFAYYCFLAGAATIFFL